jgi:small subunit ribosomal protein S8
MSIDRVGDFLTVIRNGARVSKPFIVSPYSAIKNKIALILKDEGFIKDCSVIELDNKKHIKIVLKYVDNESVIHEITRISTPGRRFYTSGQDIAPVIGGLGVSILTTNRGIITHKTARQLNVGGEVICTIW